MSYELREEAALTIAGISARVRNAEPQRIGDLWRRFYAEGGVAAHPWRAGDAVYSAYCEYEGDWNQPYTLVIGCAAASDAAMPGDLKRVAVPAGRFAVLQALGELPQAVFAAWSEVWATPLDRLYKADYDVYATDGAVSIHVGLR